MRLAIIALGIMLVAPMACSGGKPPSIKIGAPPAKMTKGTLAGDLCQGNACKCRSGAEDGGTGVPADGRKRYEIRMESAYDLWVTVEDAVLYKSAETASTCFYVDLAAGKHPLGLRASNKAGVSFSLEVRELGTKTKSWYDTFTFKCGHPGVCSFDELDTKKKEYAGVKRGLHDACGSTKIKSVIWDHGKSPDNQYPNELAVQLSLDIYKFAPWKPHGDGSCGLGGGRGPNGEATFGESASEQPASP